MERRHFLITSVALAAGASATPLSSEAAPTLPLQRGLRKRTLYLEPRSRGGFLLYSDGAREPRKLIRPEAIDARFGKGTHHHLLQPDHWAMIDAGWFEGEDLYGIEQGHERELEIWGDYYRAECEAFDLLRTLFDGRVDGFFRTAIPELGLLFGEHPCSPRLATVYLEKEHLIGKLVSTVAGLSKWVEIDPTPREQ
ncbi:hypothetical protein [Celeribacter litoreus]|uniref:hypothetical protein n=1 Tax=Celeribacter litoreus TaxID=2876714 RepID=UPI001CCF74A7|nr:hypothetical protein [Celeribacter litoreus]MCA0044668.1 hypothetical protein [Celeribacter litoreus]